MQQMESPLILFSVNKGWSTIGMELQTSPYNLDFLQQGTEIRIEAIDFHLRRR